MTLTRKLKAKVFLSSVLTDVPRLGDRRVTVTPVRWIDIAKGGCQFSLAKLRLSTQDSAALPLPCATITCHLQGKKMSAPNNVILSNCRYCTRISEVTYSESFHTGLHNINSKEFVLCSRMENIHVIYEVFKKSQMCLSQPNWVSIWAYYLSNPLSFSFHKKQVWKNYWPVKSPHLTNCNSRE